MSRSEVQVLRRPPFQNDRKVFIPERYQGMYHVYVIQNPKGILYKGYTSNLNKRLEQHNADDGFQSYTKKKGPWTLVYKEEYTNEDEAKRREKFLKTGKGREFLKKEIGRLSAQADG